LTERDVSLLITGVWTFQDEAVEVVVSILSCKPSIARALLRFYRWDSEKIMSKLHARFAACSSTA
jgi:hypothetical protein